MPIVSKEIPIAEGVVLGGRRPQALIAGPCVIESEDHALALAGSIKDICTRLKMPFIFKASYDKANRTSGKSFRGPGLKEGLAVLQRVKETLGVPVLSDVHETGQVDPAAEVLDVIQIPALLIRQTDLVVRAARTGKPLNLKKGQFMAPEDMKHVLDKVLDQGNDKAILTERGACFGYHNLVFDVRSIPIMKKLGCPVVIDATHSIQRPGGEGDRSGGDAEFIPTVAAAGTAAGADALFVEVHDHPDRALSDGGNSLNIKDLYGLLSMLVNIRKAVLGGES
jgi:2-dehydro-3-deoxyphosphooctonate aldolase (KDO 8-P synthase)